MRFKISFRSNLNFDLLNYICLLELLTNKKPFIRIIQFNPSKYSKLIFKKKYYDLIFFLQIKLSNRILINKFFNFLKLIHFFMWNNFFQTYNYSKIIQINKFFFLLINIHFLFSLFNTKYIENKIYKQFFIKIYWFKKFNFKQNPALFYENLNFFNT